MSLEIQKLLEGTDAGVLQGDLVKGELGVNVNVAYQEMVYSTKNDTGFLHFPSEERLNHYVKGGQGTGAEMIGFDDSGLANISGLNVQSALESIDALLLSSGVSGFTEGSVPFADSSGTLAEDNANFFWDDTAKSLKIDDVIISSKTINLAGGTIDYEVGNLRFNFNKSINAIGNIVASQDIYAGSLFIDGTQQFISLCNGIGYDALGQILFNTTGEINFTTIGTQAFKLTATTAEIGSGRKLKLGTGFTQRTSEELYGYFIVTDNSGIDRKVAVIDFGV